MRSQDSNSSQWAFRCASEKPIFLCNQNNEGTKTQRHYIKLILHVIVSRNTTHTQEAMLQILLLIYWMPFTTHEECPQPRKGKQDCSLAQALPEQPELCSRCTATFFPADMIPEAEEKQDKNEKALIGLPAWLSSSLPVTPIPITSIPFQDCHLRSFFLLLSFLIQQLKHTVTQRLYCCSCNSPALPPTQNLHKKSQHCHFECLDSLIK